MFDKLLQRISENNVSLSSTLSKSYSPDFLVTIDGKKVAQQVLSRLNSYFSYSGTKCVLDIYAKCQYRDMSLFEKDVFHISYKDEKVKHSFPFSYCVVTSDESYYESMKSKIDITYIDERQSFEFLHDYDLVLCVDCPQVSWHIEHSKDVSQEEATIISLYEEALESYSLFESCKHHVSSAKTLINTIDSVTPKTQVSNMNYTDLLEKANNKLEEQMQSLSFSTMDMLSSLSSGQLPDSLIELIYETCDSLNLPRSHVSLTIPLTLNEEIITTSKTDEIRDIAYKSYILLCEKKEIFLQINSIISTCNATILLHDFICGIRQYMKEYNAQSPKKGCFTLSESQNMLIANPQPITYTFDSYQSLLLTGANSGGKTTLLEHIIQTYVLYDLCLPISGFVTIDTSIKRIYYFAKNKGGAKKGAFEQLLHKLSQVKSHSLILADEMEAVTEPSVAASIMSTTLSYFHTLKCRMILATHLGKIVQPLITKKVRVDGIIAKGLDEKNNVIIDHNPVMGKIAESTPELIVQKMALKKRNDYLSFLAQSFD